MRHTKSRIESTREVIDRFCRAHGVDQYTSEEVATWGEAIGDLKITREERHGFLCELVAKASRDDVFIDHRGRKVRLRYAARMEVKLPELDEDGSPVFDPNGELVERVVQRTFWSHIDTATDEFMTTALDQMVLGIDEDIKAYFACLDFYNEKREARNLRPYQPELPFERPLEE